MPRQPRIEVPGGFYHVATRGNNKGRIIETDAHRRAFLGHVMKVTRAYGWVVYAWCLMTNHYHLVFQIGDRGISNGMRDLNRDFARWMNRALRRCDHLFGRRYWSELLETDAHLLNACRYVDLNPCEAAMCEHPGEFVWSGYRATVGMELPAPFHAVHELHRVLGARTPERGAASYEAYVLERLRAADRAAAVAATAP